MSTSSGSSTAEVAVSVAEVATGTGTIGITGGLGSAKAPAEEDDFDEGEVDMDSIPEDIRDEYFALLDFYSPEELESVRAEMGDAGISMLCQSEFGDDYYGMFGDYREEVVSQ